MPKIILPPWYSSAKVDPEHIQRLKSLGKWRIPKEGSREWIDFRLKMAASTRNAEFNRKIKELYKVGLSTAEVISNNGAGLPADAGIREFGDDYNRRVMKFGLHYLPTSFNILESYFDYSVKYAVFIPLTEKNYICTLAGYLDYLSTESAESVLPKIDAQSLLPEGQILHFSLLDEFGQWKIGHEGKRFIFRSASLVRRGNEITIFCLAGMEADLRTATEEILDSFSSYRPNPEKPALQPDPELKPEAVPFDNTGLYWRTYIAIRFNLTSQNIQARYLFADNGNTWKVSTDDPVSLNSMRESYPHEQLEKWMDKYIEAVDEQKDLFIFVTRLMRLPEYFSRRDNMVTKDKTITSLVDLGKNLKGKRKIENAMALQRVYEREVYTLRTQKPDMAGVILPVLHLKVETEGYWEKLPFGTYGEGPDGERVIGRTWVRRTLSKRQSDISSSTVAYELTEQSGLLIKPDPGYIYVLRNASHQIDIFKIGLTRRNVDSRASELSRGTGIPDQFLVVQSWWVPDVVYAERRIHEILDEFRMQDKREFFRAEYTAIRAAIDLVINELCGRVVQ